MDLQARLILDCRMQGCGWLSRLFSSELPSLLCSLALSPLAGKHATLHVPTATQPLVNFRLHSPRLHCWSINPIYRHQCYSNPCPSEYWDLVFVRNLTVPPWPWPLLWENLPSRLQEAPEHLQTYSNHSTMPYTDCTLRCLRKFEQVRIVLRA